MHTCLSQLKTKCNLQAWSNTVYWWPASYPKLLSPVLWIVCLVCLVLLLESLSGSQWGWEGTWGHCAATPSLCQQAGTPWKAQDWVKLPLHQYAKRDVQPGKQLCWSEWLWQVASPWNNSCSSLFIILRFLYPWSLDNSPAWNCFGSENMLDHPLWEK